jgi:CheY-like chemotaxis protein
MSIPPRVLLVSQSDGVSKSLATQLAAAGYEPVLASEFTTAKALLDTRPDLLIADVKLGAYNGLHLAIRAGGLGLPAIVIGGPDPVLKADAERQQALYLTPPVDSDRLSALITKLLSLARHTRRSARKHVPPIEVSADEFRARLLDVSYDGMRLEAAAKTPVMLPPYFIVRLPQFNFACRVQRVWTAPVSSEDADPAALWCGAAVAAADPETAFAWRALVDAMPGLGLRV